MNLLHKLKPGVSRRTLLFIAGVVWVIAGYGLFVRAIVQLLTLNHYLYLDLSIGLAGGIGFYLILFKRISKKHINRIGNIKVEKPCFFSFFSWRSYLMMIVMISGGITLRKLDFIDTEYFYTFYMMMCVPLFISAIRFFIAWYRNTMQI